MVADAKAQRRRRGDRAMEAMPSAAKRVTGAVAVPTISIGAGQRPGRVLVNYDMLDIYGRKAFREELMAGAPSVKRAIEAYGVW